MKQDGRMAVTAAGTGWLRYWLPVVAYAGLIFYLSSQSRPSPPTLWLLAHLGDKTLHAIEYAILGILCYRAFAYAAGDRAARSALMLAIITSIGYGVTDEVHQAFVPQRHPNGWDLLADAIGATLAASCWHWLPASDRDRAARASAIEAPSE
jgi:VanZ family protein